MRKILSTALTISILGLNSLPAAAVIEPKQFKSMVKANKKVSNDYKYGYVNLQWWQNFNDPVLNEYIERAILNNYDLKMASISVDEYYQNVRTQLANELPSASIGFTPAYARLPEMLGGTTGWNFIAPLMAQYEADIFLKNRDKTKAVKKLYEASKFDERAAYIAVASAVGATYLNILKLDKMVELQQEIVSSRKTIYDLMLLRNKEGLTSTADTIKANQALAAGNSDLLELKKQREKLLNQLAVLIGENPENAAQLKRGNINNLKLANVPAEISSEVITQRPDYMKAEKMVEKAGIDVRVAKKEFLPTINLTGIALFNASRLGSLLTTSNAIAALAASTSLPILTSGRRIANLRLKKNTYERILQDYYKTNLTAIQEVNDAMVALKLDREKLTLTAKQEQLQQKEYQYNEKRYKEGAISKLDLIRNKENLLVMNKLATQHKVECLVDYIGLYKAAGAKI
jgi:NodT family efflux transporter outer membrane factor (OMF) lipoprotein